jgi:hypothetical protein
MIQKKEEWAEHYSALELFKADITTLAIYLDADRRCGPRGRTAR